MSMDEAKRARLEAAGWKSGDAADFLGMDDDERALLELRYNLSVEVKRIRKATGMSQVSLAALAKTTQPKIAAIENGGARVGMDLFFRAFYAAGGRVELIAPPVAD